MFRGLVCLLFLLVGAVGSRLVQEVGFVESELISVDKRQAALLERIVCGQAALFDLPTHTTAARKLLMKLFLQDESEQTAEGCLAALKFLMDQGANVEGRDEETGATPLIIAARLGHLAIVAELIAAGADANAKNDNGITPLAMAAVQEGNSEVILALIDAGADVNAQGDLGSSALHNAAVYGHKDNAEALLSRGADASAASTVDGTTAENAVCWCLLLEENDSCNVDVDCWRPLRLNPRLFDFARSRNFVID
ncbi:hypothetical protein BSKO_05609 [Bryopsis sp. KO-2023]|nr:hypothetical protein BSKO_05609 [Bryopsis sp. KO-2023]